MEQFEEIENMIEKYMPKSLKEYYETFRKAYLKLTEFIEKDDKSEMSKAAIIHAYEYTFELWWKTVQRYLEYVGSVQDYGPSATIKSAFQYKLLEDGQIWMDMLRDRNLTVHTYKEDIANDIYERIITTHIQALKEFVEDFDNKI